MFTKRFIPILVAGSMIITWPCTIYAASQTASFTLSVTIPEHAQLPSSSAAHIHPIEAPTNPTHAQFQKDIRNNKAVYLVSFVVD